VVKLSRSSKTGTRQVTFALPADSLGAAVSVVGSFNDWTPGVHLLKRRSNGTASVAVTVPAGELVRFRYLGEGGRWFDDESVQVDAQGGLVQA